MARLIEGIEPLPNREANWAALAVQRRHSPQRHLFACSVIAAPLIVSAALEEARLDARTKVGRGVADTPLARKPTCASRFSKRCAATAAHVVHPRTDTPTTFSAGASSWRNARPSEREPQRT